MRILFPILSLFCFASIAFAKPVILEGESFEIDDALFTGSYHNAFEGEIVPLEDGKYKRGRQAISRTKAVLYGKGTVFNTMRFRFELDRNVSRCFLDVSGLDDQFEGQNLIAIKMNGSEIKRGRFFNNNDISVTRNARYMVGWNETSVIIPAGVIRRGENVLEIENLSDINQSEGWIHCFIDKVKMTFQEKVKISYEKPHDPIYYYGLAGGVEVNAWPAVNLNNNICLLKDSFLEINFYLTFPAKNDFKKTTGGIDMTLLIETDAPISVTDLKGKALNKKVAGRKTLFSHVAPMRKIKGETPHPAQGYRLMLKAEGDFNGKDLKVWCRNGNRDFRPTQFTLRSVSLKPLKNRNSIDFRSSIWGGGIPKDPAQLEDYIDMTKSAGFNHMFAGAIAPQLKAKGFYVHRRFGWFGHSFKLDQKDYMKYAATDKKGNPMKRDACPLQILKNPDHKEIGRHYHEAKKSAALPQIDGLCVDYENAPVWCYCGPCIERFKKEEGIKEAVKREDLYGKGKYNHEYKQFGRRLNRLLMTKVKEIMQAINPKLQYLSLASASDIPTYWWDGRYRGRFAIQELAKFADEIAVSGYFYELPGGLKSIIPITRGSKRYAMESGRDLRVSMISPIATTVSETPRYRGMTMRPSFVRLQILLLYAAKATGVSFFRGDCFDGSHYEACRQAIAELIALKKFSKNPLDRSDELKINARFVGERKIEIDGSQNILSRLEWHPDVEYHHDGVLWLNDERGLERVAMLFNYAEVPLDMKIKVIGLFDKKFIIEDFFTGKRIGTYSKFQLESGQLEHQVPARDISFLRIRVADSPN